MCACLFEMLKMKKCEDSEIKLFSATELQQERSRPLYIYIHINSYISLGWWAVEKFLHFCYWYTILIHKILMLLESSTKEFREFK